jgi:hypothetical protein
MSSDPDFFDYRSDDGTSGAIVDFAALGVAMAIVVACLACGPSRLSPEFLVMGIVHFCSGGFARDEGVRFLIIVSSLVWIPVWCVATRDARAATREARTARIARRQAREARIARRTQPRSDDQEAPVTTDYQLLAGEEDGSYDPPVMGGDALRLRRDDEEDGNEALPAM